MSRNNVDLQTRLLRTKTIKYRLIILLKMSQIALFSNVLKTMLPSCLRRLEIRIQIRQELQIVDPHNKLVQVTTTISKRK